MWDHQGRLDPCEPVCSVLTTEDSSKQLLSFLICHKAVSHVWYLYVFIEFFAWYMSVLPDIWVFLAELLYFFAHLGFFNCVGRCIYLETCFLKLFFTNPQKLRGYLLMRLQPLIYFSLCDFMILKKSNVMKFSDSLSTFPLHTQ